jgi:hypothetical protein
MADQNNLPSEEEISRIIKRADLTLPDEQLEKCRAVLARIEVAARRQRNDLTRNDEPASAFRARR